MNDIFTKGRISKTFSPPFAPSQLPSGAMQCQPESPSQNLKTSFTLQEDSFEGSFCSTTMQLLTADKAGETEIRRMLYSFLLPVYIIPAASHQAAGMKTFHRLSMENLFFPLKPSAGAQRAHRCCTFAAPWMGRATHLKVKSKVEMRLA